MKYFIKVNFFNSNKHYNFGTEDSSIKKDDKVIVETIKGLELAFVVSDLIDMSKYKSELTLKDIIRKADKNDIKLYEENLIKADKAAIVFNQETSKLKLEMKLLSTEYTLDGSKVVFTYTASDRIDFRELLKVLATKLKCRIELKQIAPRDRAQITGGLGPCGLPLCCSRFLKEFDGISINRAKNQLLTINVSKLSGQCGKLLCCLKFEDDLYTEEKKKFPNIDTKVMVNGVQYKITSFNVLSKSVRLDSEDSIINLSLDEVNKLLNPNKNNNNFNNKNNNQNNNKQKKR